MISLRVMFFVTLTVRALAYVQAYPPWSSPMSFTYKYKDELRIEITLQKIPRWGTHYVVYVNTENCDKSITEKFKQQGSHCYEPITQISEIYKPIVITKKLHRGSIRLDIALLRNTYQLCSTKRIMEGVRDETADKVENYFRTTCLNNAYIPCTITVDFEDECEEKIDCSHPSNGRLTCESLDEDLPADTVHQWYQVYKDGSSIGSIPPVKGKISKFIISLYQFDDIAYIYNEMVRTHGKRERFTQGFKIAATKKRYEITKTETYSELKTINFTCANIAHTQIGWIDPTGYKITTYNVTFYSSTFNKTANNSMLCCLHYNTYSGTVERIVDSMTVLIYEESVNLDSEKDGASPELTNSQDAPQVTLFRPSQAPKKIKDPSETEITSSTSSSTTPQAPAKTTSSLKPKAPQISTLAEKTHYQPQSYLGSTQDPPSDNTKYYIGIVSVAGIIILISIIYVVVKKCCRKPSDPEQTFQLETYASSNMVLYAELDIRPGNAPPTASTEDPTYAEIIGVLRPQNENDKQ